MRLCWDVILTPIGGFMVPPPRRYRDGEVLVRRCLTEAISDVTYRVYTSDSPTPRSPGYDALG